jgi:putative transposase
VPTGLRRLHASEQSHFVTFSCYHRQPLLTTMSMQDAFLEALEQSRRRFEMHVYAYVVMPEHVHLLVSEPADEKLSRFIQIVKARVAVGAQKAGKRKVGGEPFWQARYFDHNVRNQAGFDTQLRYIHRNPVKRGLCATPEDWKWSSFRAWALGEVGIVEAESDMIAARREALRMGISLIDKGTAKADV